MGCASSAPLVQQGLDGAKQKAKNAAAEASHIKDEAVDKMKEAGEAAKEKAIEVKDDIEEKMSSLVHSGRTSAEDAAEQAKKEAEKATTDAQKAAADASEAGDKAVEEANQAKEDAMKDMKDAVDEVKDASSTAVEEVKIESAKQDIQPGVDKIVFIDVREDSVVIQEVVIGSVDFSSRASTAAAHTPDVWTRPEDSPGKFPASELEDIKHEIEEDLKGMDNPASNSSSRLNVSNDGSKLDEIETEQENKRDLEEAAEDIREKKINETNDEEAAKIEEETQKILNEGKTEINVGDDIEREAEELKKESENESDAGPDNKEENNNSEKHSPDRPEEKQIEV